MCSAALEILTCNCLKWQRVHFTIIDWLLALMTTPLLLLLLPIWHRILSGVHWCVPRLIPLLPSPYLTLSYGGWGDDIERRMCPFVRAQADDDDVSETNSVTVEGVWTMLQWKKKPFTFLSPCWCADIDFLFGWLFRGRSVSALVVGRNEVWLAGCCSCLLLIEFFPYPGS